MFEATLSFHSCFLYMWNIFFLIQPGVTLKHAKEGTESSTFWFALGGKQSYNSKKVSQEIVRDPHLYAFSFSRGDICSLISYKKLSHLVFNCYLCWLFILTASILVVDLRNLSLQESSRWIFEFLVNEEVNQMQCYDLHLIFIVRR